MQLPHPLKEPKMDGETKGTYRILDHTADIGIAGVADDLETLFAVLAKGMFELISSPMPQHQKYQKHEIQIGARDTESLLVDWLNELLFIFETEKLLLVRFAVSLSASGLMAEVWGAPLEGKSDRINLSIKAVTYHGLDIKQQGESKWLGQVYFDI